MHDGYYTVTLSGVRSYTTAGHGGGGLTYCACPCYPGPLFISDSVCDTFVLDYGNIFQVIRCLDVSSSHDKHIYRPIYMYICIQVSVRAPSVVLYE